MNECNRCGACCYPREGWERIYSQMKWLMPDGSCKHLDHATNLCRIYEDRPWFCRLSWGEKTLAYCDTRHLELYGCEREEEECTHRA